MPDVNFVFIVDSVQLNLTKTIGFDDKYFCYSLTEFLNKEPTNYHKNIYISLIGKKDKENLIDLGLNESN